jgi:hypothetical protein
MYCCMTVLVTSRVYNQCVNGIAPSALMQGRKRDWRDLMRIVVRQVAGQEVPWKCPVTGGGVMVMV